MWYLKDMAHSILSKGFQIQMLISCCFYLPASCPYLKSLTDSVLGYKSYNFKQVSDDSPLKLGSTTHMYSFNGHSAIRNTEISGILTRRI